MQKNTHSSARKSSVNHTGKSPAKKGQFNMMPMIIMFVCCGLAIVGALFLLNKNSSSSDSTDSSSYSAENSSGYAGASEDGGQVYWVVNQDVTEGTYAIKASDGTVTVYDGPVSKSDSGVFTQTDKDSGNSISFTVVSWTDSSGNPCFALTDTSTSRISIVYSYDVSEVRTQIALLENQ